MSQTKVWTANSDNVTRTLDDGTLGQGDGGSQRMIVGRSGGSGTRRNYISYEKFALDWSGVGRIVSAILTVYTDIPQSGTPTVVVRRLKSAFSEGNNPDGTFDSGDYTKPSYTTEYQKVATMQKAAGAITNIDITDMVRRWAPATVTGGGKAGNYGLGFYGYPDPTKDWSGYSKSHTTAGQRPVITLTYELGPTTPDTPAVNMAPSGAVASIGAFEGDFSDPRPEDTLARTQVQVYTATAVKSGTGAAATSRVTTASHGLAVNDLIWFHSLTGGSGLRLDIPYYVREVPSSSTFRVSATLGGTIVPITVDYSALTWAKPLWVTDKRASETEISNAHFNVVPSDLHIVTDTNYKWRARVIDQESRWSLWSALITFSVTNTNPDAPTITPAAGTFDSLNGIVFRGGEFSDPDVGDVLAAYQVQASAYGVADPNWDDPTYLMWDTGKVYVASGSTNWQTPYTGQDLTAGTWYIRARQWDQNDGVSDWAYTTLVLTTSFDADPGTQSSVQIDPHAPWRIRIREMLFEGAGGNITGVASTNLITTTSNHGFSTNRKVRFATLAGGAGLVIGRDYYVIASGLGAKTFRVSEELGGTAVDFTTDITSGTVTAIISRAPGRIVGVLENANATGATVVYNSPGDAHWTLPVDHPQIGVIEPKQTHYGIDFYSGDGWRETFAGLVWDADASETQVQFIGVDYLALYDTQYDDRYYVADPNRSFSKGGSYYVNQTIRTVVIDQLTRAKTRPQSPVGFITIGNIATMNELVTIYSTMQPCLAFVGGLLESHKQGTTKNTRIVVRRVNAGSYRVDVIDNPGTVRDNLRLKYGELVQGYRIKLFGDAWSSVTHSIGRTREGLRVLYKTVTAPGIDQTVWGRIARAVIVDNVSDEPDLIRRTRQMAIAAGKVGANLALGVRLGFLQPLDGYDITDSFPVSIIHGAINTENFGSGYWNAMAVTWEGSDQGESQTTLTLIPRNDTASPDADLLTSSPISPQAEWQIGWTPPTVTLPTSRYWLDQSTGIVYERVSGDLIAEGATGTV